ncbi:hypothetical protein DSD19_13515 [Rhodovulum sp. BSW8]|uniref:hypothetical protein n=1 Tax=Rhodovulum sp. BSW8 TaxID=2259645 RepID=UPI000DE1AC5E|nr:hypothetical protein [Rhodovulum sp. BSW8]RBO52605.1 hypothetical protein DSD19_13515 [Rhodovulum sp. BSW8]
MPDLSPPMPQPRVGARAVPAGAVLAAVTLAALILRLPLLLWGADALDRQVFPDDTYYVLSIARNIAAGLGPTADGTVPTTGFQPLIVALLVPIFRLTADPVLPALAAAAIGAIAGALAAGLAARLALALTGSCLAAAGVGLVLATGPVFALTHPNGLETALAAAALLATAVALAETRPGAPMRRFVGIGGLAGLAVLARVDAAVLLAPAGIWAVRALGWRGAGRAALTAFAVIAPWVGVCLWLTGNPLPESGAAVATLAAADGFDGWMTFTMGVLALGGVWPDAVFGWAPMAGIAVAAAILLPLLAVRRGHCAPLAAALALGCLALFLAYTLGLGAVWFFERYFSPIHCLVPVLAAALVFGRSPPLAVRVLWGLAVLALCGFGLWRLAPVLSDPGTERLHAFAPPSGYGEMARDLLPELPPGATLGALQSGALGYFAPPGLRVVNLDGVVNGLAAAALREGRVCTYLKAAGITHFADWDLNRALLLRRVEPGATVVLDPLYRSAVAQGRHRVTLYSVTADCTPRP